MFFWLLALVLRLSKCLMRYNKRPAHEPYTTSSTCLRLATSTRSSSVRLGLAQSPAM